MVDVDDPACQAPEPEENQLVAGEIIPIESTSLLLSGMQTNLSWIIPAVVIAASTSAFLLRRK